MLTFWAFQSLLHYKHKSADLGSLYKLYLKNTDTSSTPLLLYLTIDLYFPSQILVATPGRLRDHIENTAGFATRLMGVKVLVLDEADHLLDMGFRKDIERIITAIPKQRQTLLFSATVPEEVFIFVIIFPMDRMNSKDSLKHAFGF